MRAHVCICTYVWTRVDFYLQYHISTLWRMGWWIVRQQEIVRVQVRKLLRLSKSVMVATRMEQEVVRKKSIWRIQVIKHWKVYNYCLKRKGVESILKGMAVVKFNTQMILVKNKQDNIENRLLFNHSYYLFYSSPLFSEVEFIILYLRFAYEEAKL